MRSRIAEILPDKNALILLRIPFSFFLMPVFLLSLSESHSIDGSAIFSFFIIHLLLYPASNGYNSYVDRDTTPIGGLARPPLPRRNLFYLTLVMDLAAVVLSFQLNASFGSCTL